MNRLWGITFEVAALTYSSICTAATLTVDLNGGADYTNIQAAIDAAKEGDTVLVKPGEYVMTNTINFNSATNWGDPVKNRNRSQL